MVGKSPNDRGNFLRAGQKRQPKRKKKTPKTKSDQRQYAHCNLHAHDPWEWVEGGTEKTRQGKKRRKKNKKKESRVAKQ